MDFIQALLHTPLGYGIRRKVWGPNGILYYDAPYGLRWVNAEKDPTIKPPTLLGPDRSYDLSAEDITANDWEAI